MKKSLLYFSIALFISVVLFLINGCATIFGWGKAEVVNIRSNPDNATITVNDEGGTKIFEGQTPTNIPLEKKKGYFSGKTYSITISKDGYTDKTIMVDTKANGWYIGGNIIFGGLIGWLIVDPATGAMWTFDTNDINVDLVSSDKGSMLENNSKVVLLKDVPIELRDKLVRINK
jgi:hypothetical protein